MIAIGFLHRFMLQHMKFFILYVIIVFAIIADKNYLASFELHGPYLWVSHEFL